MRFQTLFFVASAVCSILAAPIREKRAANPVVVTIYEEVVHVVTATSTIWVPAPPKTEGNPAPTTIEAKTTSTTVTPEPTTFVPEPTTTDVPPQTTTPAPETTIPVTIAAAKVKETTTYVPPEPTTTYVPPEPTTTYVPPEPTTTKHATTTTAPVETPVAPPPVAPPAGGSGEPDKVGDATYYDTGVGSCGSTSTNSDYIVALSHFVMSKTDNGNPNHNPLCGKQIVATRGDKWVTATVVDTCGSCLEGDIDLSPAAFQVIGAPAEGRIKVTWNWA